MDDFYNYHQCKNSEIKIYIKNIEEKKKNKKKINKRSGKKKDRAVTAGGK